LTPLDFFLWGLLKGHVCSNKQRAIDTLKYGGVAAITDVTLPDVFGNLQTHIQKFFGAGGADFQHIL
jgi:hypothetical protein